MQDGSQSVLLADRPFWLSREDHDEVQSFTSKTLSYGHLSAGRYKRCRNNPDDMWSSNTIQAVFMVVVIIKPIPAHRIWQDSRLLDTPARGTGALCVFDLRQVWTVGSSFPFDSIHTYITQSVLDDVTSELGVPRIERIHCPCTVNHIDQTMLGLAQALAPLLERPAEGNRLFADHTFSAIVLYLATEYGGLEAAAMPPKLLRRGRLTLSQKRNVTDRLLNDLNDVPGIAELASMCKLSQSHFVRDFKQTTGLPPHRWLLMQRVKRAEILLQDTKMQVSEIALECGFADQSHLTRVFTKAVGVSPQAWRRQRRG